MRTMTDLVQQIEIWIQSRQLIRLSLVQKGIGRKVFHGRVLQFSAQEMLILFYHDDEKKVYNISLNEIEDIAEANTKRKVVELKEELKIEELKVEELQEVEKRETIPEKLLDPEFLELFKEITSICNKLTKQELSALIPLLKILQKK